MSHLHRLFTLTSYRQTQQQQQQHTKISAQSAVMAPRLFFLLFLLSEAASEPVVIVARVKPVGPEVRVELGQNVTLPCQAGDVTITAAEWTRSDLVDPDYVLLQKDGRSDPTHQNSSFKGRVQLVDDQLKTRNVSLILKNVSREDVGTYECRVVTAGSRRKKTDPNSIVMLQVTDPESQKGGNNNGTSTPHHVGLAAAAVVVLVSAAVGLFLVRKCKRQRENEPEPSDVAETGDNLL